MASPKSAIEGGGSPDLISASLDPSDELSPSKSLIDLESPNEQVSVELQVQLSERKSSNEAKSILQLVQIAEGNALYIQE